MLPNEIAKQDPVSQQGPSGLEQAGVIDFLGFNADQNEVLLVLVEGRPWDLESDQPFQLQEKLNAYLSFVLDGEMADSYPSFVNKPVRIRLECVTPPPEELYPFLQLVHDQCSLQGIAFEVEVMGKGCGCGKPAGECGRPG